MLRGLLRTHTYTAEAVCKRTGIPTIYAFRTLGHGRDEGTTLDDGLDVLIRLFLDVEEVPVGLIGALLGDEAPGLLAACGLARAGTGPEETLAATVLLYPSAGPWIVSDRLVSPDLDPERDGFAEDAVYPAITRSAMVFLSTLCTTPCRRFLELCSGTGIAALIAAEEFAEQAWAVDITERSTVFARFNAALNGLENVTALQGDLWDPVAGQTFDRIAAHPPYMAARRTTFVYRDGGEDGEQITRRVLAGAREHLAPGGVLHCTCMLTDRVGDPLGARVRRMLGAGSDDLDLLILENSRVDAWSHLSSRLMKAEDSQVDDAVEQMRAFRDLEVQGLVFATVVVRRTEGGRAPLTLMRTRAPGTRWPQIAWALDVAGLLAGPGGVARVASARPRLSPHARLHVRYRVATEGEEPWTPEAGHVEVTHPFVQGGDATLAVARFLGRCDGTMALTQHLEAMKSAGEVPPEASEADFVGMVRGLLELGVLELDDLPVPAVPPERPGAAATE